MTSLPSQPRRQAGSEVILLWASLIVVAVVAAAGASLPVAASTLLFVGIQGGFGLETVRRTGRWSSSVLVVGVGLAVGSGFTAVVGALAATIGLDAWFGVAIAATAWLILVLLRLRKAKAAVSQKATRSIELPTSASELWALGLSMLLMVGSLAVSLTNHPLNWLGSWSRYHPDMAYFEALSTSIAWFGAQDSIFTPDATVRYHWLTYAWAGQLSELAGAPPFVVLTRVLPVFAMVAGALIVVGWTRSLSQVAWAPSLAVVLLFAGGYLGIAYGGTFNFDSPSQSMGVIWVLAFAVVVLQMVRERAASRGRVVLLGALVALLSLALVGGKVSAAAPGLAGVGLLALIGLARREEWRWRALAAAAVAGAAAVGAFIVILAGANGGGGLTIGSLVDRISSQQGMNPVDGLRGVLFGTLIVATAIAARWIGLVWLSADRESRWAPLTIFGWGLVSSSLMALFLFNSFNELWFSSAASGPLAVIGAVGAAGAATRLRGGSGWAQYRVVIAAGFLGLLVFTVVWVLWITGPSGGNIFVSTYRWLAPLAGVGLAGILGSLLGLVAQRRWTWIGALAGSVLVLTASVGPARALGFGTGQVGQLTNGIRNEWFTTGQAHLIRGLDTEFISDWTSTRMEAGRWLRQNSESHDLVATNVTLDAFVPAVTHLQTYVSGIHYQGPYGPPGLEAILLERERESWAFIDTPSADTAKPLCDADVKWLWIDTERTARRDWEPWASIKFSRPDVLIARINSSACP